MTGITQGGGGKEKKKNSVERKGRIAKENMYALCQLLHLIEIISHTEIQRLLSTSNIVITTL